MKNIILALVVMIVGLVGATSHAVEKTYRCPSPSTVRLIKMDLDGIFKAASGTTVSYSTTKSVGPGESLPNTFSVVSCKKVGPDAYSDSIFLECSQYSDYYNKNGSLTLMRCSDSACQWNLAFERTVCEGSQAGTCGASDIATESCDLVK